METEEEEEETAGTLTGEGDISRDILTKEMVTPGTAEGDPILATTTEAVRTSGVGWARNHPLSRRIKNPQSGKGRNLLRQRR